MTENSTTPYWASVGTKEIAENILEKAEKYYEYLSMSGRMDLWRRSWFYYYRPRVNGAMLAPAGQQGELTTLSVNQFRSILSGIETITTQQQATFEPVATNSDQDSQAQVILASNILDYYMREKKLNRNFVNAVKEGLIWSECFIRCEWDAQAGEVFGQGPNGAPIREGDLKYTNYSPFNAIRDYTQTRHDSKRDWIILRDFKNKFDLAAKYPELSEKILEDSPDQLNLLRTTTLNYSDLDDSDNVPVYTLLHPITPAMPQGRYTEVLSNNTVLIDGPLPYDMTHVYRIAPDEEVGTIFGYTVAFDLLPIQEALDICYSTEITNISAFGVQNLLLPIGHNLSYSQLTGGLNAIECDMKNGKPEPLNLLSTPPEVYNMNGVLVGDMQTVSGYNSVARGNVDKEMSGAAMALLQSQAIQYNSGLQRSYAQLIEDVGTATIKITQVYAKVPRIAQIVGKSNLPYLKKYTGNDLSGISRVNVNMGNPLMNTIAGRTNLADTFMANNMIENPDQYVQVVTTGRFEPIIDGIQKNLLLIKGENEGLASGVPQRALITDEHAKHILEHTAVLSNPNIRQNPSDPIVELTLQHIQEHMTLAATPGYQAMAASLGHQITVPMAQPQAPGGQVGEMLNPAPQAVQDAQQVQQPNMPNPPQGTDPQSAEIIKNQQMQ